ncbi:MAG: hypothetical protein FWJ72_14800 [Acidimicrobiia bacterium]
MSARSRRAAARARHPTARRWPPDRARLLRGLAERAAGRGARWARVAAAEVLLDRAWGKPTQPIGEDGKGLVLRIAGLGPEDLAILEREELE